MNSGNIKGINASKKNKRVLSERHLTRKKFWTQLLTRSKDKTDLFSRKSPGVEHYLGVSAGKRGISYNYIITTTNARVELYIDNGDGNWNKSAFDTLGANKSKIEAVFGHSPVWERLDDKRASAIRFSIDQAGLRDKDNWPELQDYMIEMMIKFEKAFQPFIREIG